MTIYNFLHLRFPYQVKALATLTSNENSHSMSNDYLSYDMRAPQSVRKFNAIVTKWEFTLANAVEGPHGRKSGA